jgi:FtsZ-interacting cell division protein YlmF
MMMEEEEEKEDEEEEKEEEEEKMEEEEKEEEKKRRRRVRVTNCLHYGTDCPQLVALSKHGTADGSYKQVCLLVH